MITIKEITNSSYNDLNIIDITIFSDIIFSLDEDKSQNIIFKSDDFNPDRFKNRSPKKQQNAIENYSDTMNKLMYYKIFKNLFACLSKHNCSAFKKNISLDNGKITNDNIISFSYYLGCKLNDKIFNTDSEWLNELKLFEIRMSNHFTKKHNLDLLDVRLLSKCNLSLYNSSTKTLYDYIDTILKVRCDQLVAFLKEVQDYCKINKIPFNQMNENNLPNELALKYNKFVEDFNKVKIQPENDPIFLKFKATATL